MKMIRLKIIIMKKWINNKNYKNVIIFIIPFINSNKKLIIQINKIDPLNWSILISGGKENNNDFHSNGEWKGKSPSIESKR